MTGTFYGLGIGPGDPELITLKALRIIEKTPIIAYPAPELGESLVRAIAAPHIPSGKIEIIIRTPIIPRVTDAGENLSLIADVMQENGLSEIELLPWNPHSAHYYHALGKRYPFSRIRPPGKAKLTKVERFFEGRGIRSRVVG